MEQVVTSIGRVTDIMAEISSASQEQTGGIEQVNQAIGQMDEVTQQNAALVEESAAAAGSMEDQAAQLAKVASVFKLDRQAAPVAPARSATVRLAVARTAAARPAPRAERRAQRAGDHGAATQACGHGGQRRVGRVLKPG